MAKIIDGKRLAQNKLDLLKRKIECFTSKPSLAIIMVGNHPSSTIYVANKMKAAKATGINAMLIELQEDVAEEKLLSIIEECNLDPDVDGIIVQLPLPQHIDKYSVINKIAPYKDVDGFHPINVGMLYSGREPVFVPCTPLGVLDILKETLDSLSGKNAVIIGRSNIVGRPLASLLLRDDVTVTICHSKTLNIWQYTKNADIVISACGDPLSLGVEYFSEKAIAVDVGITKTKSGALCGDIKFDEVAQFVSAITPVPGGVGPLTVANLLSNVVRAFEINRGEK